MAAKARKRDELRGGTSEETALIQSAQDAEGYADELDAALNEESSNE